MESKSSSKIQTVLLALIVVGLGANFVATLVKSGTPGQPAEATVIPKPPVPTAPKPEPLAPKPEATAPKPIPVVKTPPDVRCDNLDIRIEITRAPWREFVGPNPYGRITIYRADGGQFATESISRRTRSRLVQGTFFRRGLKVPPRARFEAQLSDQRAWPRKSKSFGRVTGTFQVGKFTLKNSLYSLNVECITNKKVVSK